MTTCDTDVYTRHEIHMRAEMLCRADMERLGQAELRRYIDDPRWDGTPRGEAALFLYRSRLPEITLDSSGLALTDI